MKEIKAKHYVNTVIYELDMIIKTLKYDLKQKTDSLNIGITSEQFVVLDTIAYYKNTYQQMLSKILMKDKANTTRIIKILLEKGLIQREAGNVNGRLVYNLSVTDKGQQMVDEYMPKLKGYIANVFSDLTDEDIETLRNIGNKAHTDLIFKEQ